MQHNSCCKLSVCLLQQQVQDGLMYGAMTVMLRELHTDLRKTSPPYGNLDVQFFSGQLSSRVAAVRTRARAQCQTAIAVCNATIPCDWVMFAILLSVSMA